MATALKRARSSLPSDADEGNNHQVALNDVPDERTQALFQQVFAIKKLREKILNFAIQGEGHKLGPMVTTSACRLVQRSWLESVSECLINNRNPLIHLDFITVSSLLLNPLVYNFITAYASSAPQVLDSAPPYSLKISFRHYKRWKNCKYVLGKCLRWCPQGLTHLELQLSHTYFRPSVPAGTSFPALRTLVLQLLDDGRSAENCWGNIASEMQAILSGATRLTHLSVEALFGANLAATEHRLPDPLKTLSFPPSLTSLRLDSGMMVPGVMRLIRNNVFPAITELHLSIPETPYDGNDVIFAILERGRRTLKTVKISEIGCCTDDDREMIPIHFPLMESLTSLTIRAWFWRWRTEIPVEPLDANLPVVKHMDISGLTPFMLRRLILNHEFSTERLTIHLSKDPFDAENVPEQWRLSLALLPQAFAKVTVLDITTFIRYDAPHVFRTIFQTMTQLTQLHLCLCEETQAPILHRPKFWSFMFLGAWCPNGSAPPSGPPDITNLSELNLLQLSFVGARINNHTRALATMPDEVFQFGFLKMPKLLTLNLCANIPTSKAIAAKWKLAGRVLGS